jgi:hypothetical protein
MDGDWLAGSYFIWWAQERKGILTNASTLAITTKNMKKGLQVLVE